MILNRSTLGFPLPEEKGPYRWLMVVSKTVFMAFSLVLFAGFAPASGAEQGARVEGNDVAQTEEWNAYYHPAKGETGFKDSKRRYLQKLSPGGRIFFLTNRKDFAEALEELKSFPRQNSGSALYVKAMCLDGQERHAEAVKCYGAALSKFDLVFHPGAKFYLHYASALTNAHMYPEALKNLAIAEKTNRLFSDTVRKRRAVINEMQGNYKIAFMEYLTCIGGSTSQFQLYEPLTGGPEVCATARRWLAKHGNSSPNTVGPSSLAQARFLMIKGKAYMALGKDGEAREPISSAAMTLQNEWVNNAVNPLDFKETFNAKQQALRLLIRLDYAKGNLKDCCKTIRAIFETDPAKESAVFFSTISIKDVPQLVLQKDVDLHNAALEVSLDDVDYLHDPFAAKRERKGVPEVPRVDEKFLTQARREMSAGAYKECYASLEDFIDANVVGGFAPVQLYMRGTNFVGRYLHKVRMLQLGARLASARPNTALSLRGEINPFHSDYWKCVEERLLGRSKLNSPNDSEEFKNNRQFIAWCRYAMGLRALSKKDYQSAASEFGLAAGPGGTDEDLKVYARCLKKYCEAKH